MSFESREIQIEGKKKTHFVSWKGYFSSCYFFITPFLFHFKDDF
jgi:hypothetical protein